MRSAALLITQSLLYTICVKLSTTIHADPISRTERLKAEEAAQYLRVENGRLVERAKATDQRRTDLQKALTQLHTRFQEVAAKVQPPPKRKPYKNQNRHAPRMGSRKRDRSGGCALFL